MKNVHFSIKELYEVNRDNSKWKKRAFPFLRMCKAVEALIFFIICFYTKVLALKKKKTFASKADNVAVCKWSFLFAFVFTTYVYNYM